MNDTDIKTLKFKDTEYRVKDWAALFANAN
jgi:hypothetical protein